MADFFKALFDFNFQQFITMKLIKPLYIFFVAMSALGALFFLFTSLATMPGLAKIMALIFVPLYFLFIIITTRVWCEIIVLMFDINDRVETLAAGQQRPPTNPGSLPPL